MDRRKFIASVGTVGTVAIAGCTGGNGGNGDDGNGGNGGEGEVENEPSAQDCLNAIEIMDVDDTDAPDSVQFTLQNTLNVKARYAMSVVFTGHNYSEVDTVVKSGEIGGTLSEVVTFSPDATETVTVPTPEGGTEEATRSVDVFEWHGPEGYGHSRHPDAALASECLE